MQIIIDIPEPANNQKLELEIKTEIAFFLFKKRIISRGKACEMSNMDIYTFLEECKKKEIPTFDLEEDSLQKELKQLREAIP
jgi:predicted HTH domain antitoxin